MAKKKKQKQKLEIVFDDKSRREFLTGFHKRKVERKKRAKDELAELLKAERIRIRQKVKDSMKLMKQSYAPIPDVQHLLDEEEYENEAVHVKIVDLSTNDISRKLNFIGDNKPNYNDDENHESEAEPHDDPTEAIPGMSMTEKKVPAKKSTVKKERNIKSKKDLDKMTKQKSNQSVRSNKLFKMKAKLDSVAGKKKARIERRKKEKLQMKLERRKGHFNKAKTHKK